MKRMKPPINHPIWLEKTGDIAGKNDTTSLDFDHANHSSSRRPRRRYPYVSDVKTTSPSLSFYTCYVAFSTLTIAATVMCMLSSSIIYVNAFTPLTTSIQLLERRVALRVGCSPLPRQHQRALSKDDQATAALLVFGKCRPAVPVISAFATYSAAPRTSPRLFMASTSRSGGDGTVRPPTDQQEWRAILMSLQLYKAAYGDLKVPTLFVVPSMAPWPGMC
jgi:hypothetical protein